jgi:hypothetical protein
MSRRLCFAALLALAASGIAPASAEMLVVVHSNAKSWPAGTEVDGTKVLSLEAGAEVALVTESGRKLKLVGPYAAAPAPGGATSTGGGLVPALKALFTESDRSETTIGAIRSAQHGDAWVWTVDDALVAGQPLTVCWPAGGTIYFARADQALEERAMLDDVVSGGHADLLWPSGTSAVAWPGALLARDGDRYRYGAGDGSTLVEFSIVDVPEKFPTAAHRAIWMAQHGCPVQARRLVVVSR